MAELATADRTSEVTGFAANAAWTGATDSDRGSWLAARSRYLTASDTAAVLGHDTRRSAFQVWCDKTQPRRDEKVGIHDPRFWGKVLEQTILRAAAEEYGWRDYRPGGALLASRLYPHLAATLDAEAVIDGELAIVEGKTTSAFLRRDWDEVNQAPPVRVLLQAQHQLLVTGAPFDEVFCLAGGQKPIKIRVEPHEDVHALIVTRSAWFLDLVERMCPPPVTHLDQEALERLHPPANDGSVVRLPPEAVGWTARILEIAEEVKRLTNEDKLLRNQIRQCIGSGTYGVLESAVQDKRYWRWEEQSRPAYTVEAATFRTLSRLKKGPPVDAIWDQLPVGKASNLEELLAGSVDVARGEPLVSDEALRIQDALFGTDTFGTPQSIARKRKRAKR